MMTYYSFARTRGWPPEVVRKLRRDELYWFPLLDRALDAALEQVDGK
jgi:hypothetical protein